MEDNMIKNSIPLVNWVKIFCTALKVFVVFAVFLGILYPLFITAIGIIFMNNKANGSLIYKDNVVRGSTLIAQDFKSEKYFHPRYSAVDYKGNGSGGSNMAPSDILFKELIVQRRAVLDNENNIAINVNIPSDMLTSSWSGLDPHISIENAFLQLPRVAKKRNLSQNMLEQLISKNIDNDFIGIWGQDSVNVLKLNIALDEITGK